MVLAAVYGPVQKYNNDVNQDGHGVVDVVYKPPDGSTGSGSESKENQVVMASTLSQIILMSMYLKQRSASQFKC